MNNINNFVRLVKVETEISKILKLEDGYNDYPIDDLYDLISDNIDNKRFVKLLKELEINLDEAKAESDFLKDIVEIDCWKVGDYTVSGFIGAVDKLMLIPSKDYSAKEIINKL